MELKEAVKSKKKSAQPGIQAGFEQPQSAQAWYNDYMDERNSNFHKNSKTISAESQQKLDAMVDEMGKAIPRTYQYNFIKYIHSNRDPNKVEYLKNAEAIKPNAPELHTEMMFHYEMVGNASQRKLYSKKLYNANFFARDVLEYNEDVLSGLDQKAILITNGKIDTHPIWILQDVKGQRQDVRLINLELIHQEAYMRQLKQEFNLGSTNFSSETDFVRKLSRSLNGNRKIYLAPSVKPVIIQTLNQQLYLTGLSLEYSNTEINNVETLKSRWKTDWSRGIPHLKQPSWDGKKLLRNYLPPLITLYRVYKAEGNTTESEAVKQLLLKIAANSGKKYQVEKLLNR